MEAAVNSNTMVDRFASTFLMGKHPGFDIDHVMALVREVVEREQS